MSTRPTGAGLFVRIGARSIIAHKLRLVLTLLSVVIGTAFMTGSALFTAQLEDSFTAIVSSMFDDVDIAATGGPGTAGIPADTARALRGNPAVSKVSLLADPATVVVARPDGSVLPTGGAPTQALPVGPDGGMLGGTRDVTGDRPTGPGQVIINATALDTAGLAIGDRVVVVGPTFTRQATITGSYSSAADTGGWIGVGFDEDTYLDLFAAGGRVQMVAISLTGLKNDGAPGPGIPRGSDEARTVIAEATAGIEKTLPGAFVIPGATLADQTTGQLKQALSFLRYFLWAFAGIALLVATFLISNTFAMIVAQRTREFALLRAVGASRAQITAAVTGEAAAVGLIGSAAGVAGGVGLVSLVGVGMDHLQIGLPRSAMTLSATSVAVPMLVGTVLTILAGYVPARRAGTVAPVAAIAGAGTETHDDVRTRFIAACGLFTFGVTLLAGGAVTESLGTTEIRVWFIGAGAAALIGGLWLAGPVVVVPVVAFLGKIVGAPFGAVGHLAATNGRRFPKRTASTAFALTLGLIMVTTIGMLGATMKANVSGMIDDTVTADYVIKGPTGSTLTVPEPLAEAVTRLDDAGQVAVLRTASLTVAGKTRGVPGGRPNSTDVADLDFTPGAGSGLELNPVAGSVNLTGKAGVIIDTDLAAKTHTLPGDTIAVGTPDGEEFAVEVLGVYDPFSGLGEAVISQRTAQAIIGESTIGIQNIFASSVRRDEASIARFGEELNTAAAPYLVVSVLTKQQFSDLSVAGVDQLLAVLYGLLALAVITAILGIINTLALSVIERRTEIGMLRVVGGWRGQIRTMIYLESVVIAVTGALNGAVVGVAVGYAFLSIMTSHGINTIVIAWDTVAAMIAASAVVGVIAAAFPAHRAAATPPLAAIVND
ncbi:ABC transporter permease [Corynebacterium mendelii]|uniref:ABC transporter permease n=1 Tax=Corynebacterium mendelii TaxID=2765362 RepID=A0A939E250_9CORY|nr:ABC transporter permease [Corynebacterium mendelii]MBN9645343.1 ABC transporter permease [Corynebacterium mendelii]